MFLRGDELAYAVLDHIREHPEEWDQESYFCGSTACFAGRTVLLALGRGWEQAEYGFSPSTAAYALLGWTPEQADTVFLNFTKDFTELETQVKRVLNGA